VEEGLITPPPSEVTEEDSAFAAYIPFQVVGPTSSHEPGAGTQGELMEFQEDGWDDRLEVS
jgi:hypothetical protein